MGFTVYPLRPQKGVVFTDKDAETGASSAMLVVFQRVGQF